MDDIITEKDFWQCTEGAMPSQLQGTRLGTKRETGEKFITIEDKASSSWIDFGCKKYYLLATLAVLAIVVVAVAVGVLTIATGGLALVAVGFFIAGAGAIIGSVAGALLCGQKVASKRNWIGEKKDFISQGTKTVTGDMQMTCAAGGVISYNSQIKSWGQAIALGTADYIDSILSWAFKGACVGALAAGVVAIATGSAFAGLAGMSGRQMLNAIGNNIMRNYAGSWGFNLARSQGGKLALEWMGKQAALPLIIRGLTATSAGLKEYAGVNDQGQVSYDKHTNTSATDIAKNAAGGVFGMESGTAHSAENLVTYHIDEKGNKVYNGSLWDVGGIAMWGFGNGKLPEARVKPPLIEENTKTKEIKEEPPKEETIPKTEEPIKEEPPKEEGRAKQTGSSARKATPEEAAKLKELKEKYKVGENDKNLAYLEGNVDGTNVEMTSISGQKSKPGTVQKTPFEQQQLKTEPTKEDIQRDHTNPDRRAYDSEVKALEQVLKDTNPNSKGKIKIVSDRNMCSSCTKAIEQFKILRPNIEVEKVYIREYP